MSNGPHCPLCRTAELPGGAPRGARALPAPPGGPPGDPTQRGARSVPDAAGVGVWRVRIVCVKT
eukprot:299373-Chlamydomonas_euryale.AAC.4